MSRAPSVIFVDDEVSLLKYFKMEFCEHFQISIFDNARAALSFIEEGNEVDVVISDQRMPCMSGADFLTEVKQRYPDIQLIITTAYSDPDKLIKCVNDAGIYGYLDKPLSYDDVIQLVRTAFQIRIDSFKAQSVISSRISQWNSDVVRKRLIDITEIVRLLWEAPNDTVLSFQNSLSTITKPYDLDWSDLSLYCDKKEEELLLKFIRNSTSLSGPELGTSTVDLQSAVDKIEPKLPVYVSQTANISLDLFAVIVSVARLSSLCCEASAKVEVNCTRSEVRIDFSAQRGFGVSILDPLCDQSSQTLLKNALLLNIIIKTRKRLIESYLMPSIQSLSGHLILKY